MNDLSQSSHYQPAIQGLRAVAVLLVIVYHSGIPGLPGGYTGVDVFFVISGYLITSLLLRELTHRNTISLSRFYARRFRRLLPAATLVLLATVATAWFVYPPLTLEHLSSSALATAVYVSNLWFGYLSTDYLAEDTGADPLLHTWSLGVEEQFYLVWPLLLLLTFRVGARLGLRRRLFVAFALLLSTSFLLAYWLTGYSQPWAFFGSPTRAWEFATGGLVALWFSQGQRLTRGMALLAGCSGVVLVFVGSVLLDRSTPFPGLAALLPVVGAASLIAATHTEKPHGVARLLATGPMRLVGDMSYSLYLWHWPIFVFLAKNSPNSGFEHSLAIIAIVFVLAWLTLVLVENPIRFNRRLSSTTIQSLIAGATLTGTSAAIAFGVGGIAVTNLNDPEQQIFSAAKHDIPSIYSDGCHLGLFGVAAGECVYGKVDSPFVVVLFGDSHAAHWFPALKKLALANDWKLISMTKSSCPSALHKDFNDELGRTYFECKQWRKHALERIEALRPGLVVLSNIKRYAWHNAATKRAWETSVDHILQRLSPVSGRIVIIKDAPSSKTNVPDCLSRAAWMNKRPEAACQIATPAPNTNYAYLAEREAAAAFDNVDVIDMTHSICPKWPCAVFEDGLVKFSDRHHLSRSFSRSLSSSLEAALSGRQATR